MSKTYIETTIEIVGTLREQFEGEDIATEMGAAADIIRTALTGAIRVLMHLHRSMHHYQEMCLLALSQ